MQLRMPDGSNAMPRGDASGNLLIATGSGGSGAPPTTVTPAPGSTFPVAPAGAATFPVTPAAGAVFSVTQTAGAETAVKTAAGTTAPVAVAIGQSLSPAVDLGNYRLGRIGIPAAIDGATRLTFQTSHEGTVFRDLYDAFGTEYSAVVAPNRSVVPDLTMFAAARWIKVRMGTGAAPVVATVARTFDLSMLA